MTLAFGPHSVGTLELGIALWEDPPVPARTLTVIGPPGSLANDLHAVLAHLQASGVRRLFRWRTNGSTFGEFAVQRRKFAAAFSQPLGAGFSATLAETDGVPTRTDELVLPLDLDLIDVLSGRRTVLIASRDDALSVQDVHGYMRRFERGIDRDAFAKMILERVDWLVLRLEDSDYQDVLQVLGSDEEMQRVFHCVGRAG